MSEDVEIFEQSKIVALTQLSAGFCPAEGVWSGRRNIFYNIKSQIAIMAFCKNALSKYISNIPKFVKTAHEIPQLFSFDFKRFVRMAQW